MHAAVRNDVVAATLTEMFYEMDRMRSLPVTPEELESARNYLTGVFSLGVATQDGLARPALDRLSRPLARGLSGNVSRADSRAHRAGRVVAAARRHFDSANAQIVVVGDRAQIAEQAALFGPVTAYDASGEKQ